MYKETKGCERLTGEGIKPARCVIREDEILKVEHCKFCKGTGGWLDRIPCGHCGGTGHIVTQKTSQEILRERLEQVRKVMEEKD